MNVGMRMRAVALAALVGWLTPVAVTWAQDQAATPAAATAAVDAPAAAAPAAVANSGDTAWVLVAAALVLLMTPGLAFFYGGLVRKKNVLSILMQCFMCICIVSIQWVVFGYSLAFGPDMHHLIGNLDWAMLKSVGDAPNPSYAATIPHSVFMVFQMMFAVITPALILGAYAERMKFSSFCVFTLLWATIVYDPICHWVWGCGGMLSRFDASGALKASGGALDFAGGTVVHINAGFAALAAAIVMGKRVGSASPPHSLPFATLGAGLLWFGWFGFNAGSALAANAQAANAFIATHVATCAAGLTWAVCDWCYHKKATTLGMITGAVAGLVAITPACGFVSPISAIWIGIGVSVICFGMVTVIKAKFGYDDTLDAFGVHGIGGVWGALATGIWAEKAYGGFDGLVQGNPHQFMIQVKAVGCSIVYTFVMSLILLKAVDLFMGLRVSEHEERVGLDLTQHKETGYTLID